MHRLIPKRIKDLFFNVIRSNSSTEEVADGLAIGMFIAWLPIMGIQMYVALVVTRLFKKNTLASLIAVWVTNPLTAVPIYWFNLWVGHFLRKKSPVSFSALYRTVRSLDLQNILSSGKDILIPLWMGSMIVGIVVAYISQKLCLKYYDAIREKVHHIKEHNTH